MLSLYSVCFFEGNDKETLEGSEIVHRALARLLTQTMSADTGLYEVIFFTLHDSK